MEIKKKALQNSDAIMSAKKIKQGNIVIAQFMGGGFEAGSSMWLRHVRGLPGQQTSIHIDLGSYHTSWDWLMPACKVWDHLWHEVILDKRAVTPEQYNTYIKMSDQLDDAVTCYDIIPAFEFLVQNIEWYNFTFKE